MTRTKELEIKKVILETLLELLNHTHSLNSTFENEVENYLEEVEMILSNKKK